MGSPALRLDDDSLIEGEPTTEEEIAEMDRFWAEVDPDGHALLMGNTMKNAFGRLEMRGAREPRSLHLRKRNGRWSNAIGNPFAEPRYEAPTVSDTWIRR